MNIIELLKAIVLGMTEGFTEWLPVSAEAHLLLIGELLQPEWDAAHRDILYAVMKIGAGLAVMIMYWPRLCPAGKGKKAARKKAAARRLLLNLLVGTLPAGILWFLLHGWIRDHLQSSYVIAVMLILYGLVFLILERGRRYRSMPVDQLRKLSLHTALYIGMFQVLALVPGTSRTAAAILGALLLGCSGLVAAEFSLLLGIPAVICTSLFTLAGTEIAPSGADLLYMAAGFIAAFLVSVSSVSFLVTRARNKSYAPYGVYRMALGAVMLIWTFITSLVAGGV